MNRNVPRENLNWHPTINYDACTGDRACIDFCKSDVFVWDEENQHPVVQKRLNCVIGCDTCAQMCPVEAITFPSKDDLRKQLPELRAQLQPVGVQTGSGA